MLLLFLFFIILAMSTLKCTSKRVHPRCKYMLLFKEVISAFSLNRIGQYLSSVQIKPLGKVSWSTHSLNGLNRGKLSFA